MKLYYIAANRFEGCGHKHKLRQIAARCIRFIDKTHGAVRVHKIKVNK